MTLLFIFMLFSMIHTHTKKKLKKQTKNKKPSHFCRKWLTCVFLKCPSSTGAHGLEKDSQVTQSLPTNLPCAMTSLPTNLPCAMTSRPYGTSLRVFGEKHRGHWLFGPAQNNLTEERVGGQVKRKCSCSSWNSFIPSLICPPHLLPCRCVLASPKLLQALPDPGSQFSAWPGSSLQLHPQSTEVCDICDSAHLGNSAQASNHILLSI